MKPLSVIKIIVLAASTPLFSGCQKKLVNSENSAPNILFILTDDQRYNVTGYAGNPVIQTPNLDALAEKGTYFDNAFVTTSICAVSRACILTGQYAHTNGVHDFDTEINLNHSYPHVLREAGYYTGFIGKWGVSAQDSNYVLKAANDFDYWGGCMGQSIYWHRKDCRYVLNNGTAEKDHFFCNCYGKGEKKDMVHQDTWVIPGKVKSFLDQRDPHKPFCLSISFKAPHMSWKEYDTIFNTLYDDKLLPYAPSVSMADAMRRPWFLRHSLNGDINPKRLENPTDIHGPYQQFIRGYYRLVTGVDYAMGKIQSMLKEKGLDKNTIIVFYSDNGHFNDEHGFHGKWLMYEESLRVPGFIYDPRHPKNQVHSKELVLNIDIAPTILELAGITPPEYMEGKSMLPLLNKPDYPFRDDFFYEHYFRYKTGDEHIERTEGIRTRKYSYIDYIDQTGPLAEELYNIYEDPFQLNDLSDYPEYSSLMKKMRERRQQYRDQMKK